MGQYGIGQPVRRKEDVRLLTGKGRYTDDIHFDGQLWAAFFRSPHAHAKINAIHSEAALSVPGVRHVFTGDDLRQGGMKPIVADIHFTDRAGNKMFKPVRHILPSDRACYVGEPLVMVLADSAEAARAGADVIDVDFDILPNVTSTAKAASPHAYVIHPEHGSNVAVHWENSASDEVDALIAAATHKVKIHLVNNRLIVAPMEPRCAVATYDETQDLITLYSPTQGVRPAQVSFAGLLGIDKKKLRVISLDVGGGFGIRSKRYPETAAVAWAAKQIKRPVKWRGDRSETFVSDHHGRDQVNDAIMGLDQNGRVIALRLETIVNVGAYSGDNGPRLPIDGGGRIIPCGYDIEKFYFSVKPVYTNTVPTDTYRGAGRPEANFIMERLMDAAAQECGLARDEIRRRNLIPLSKMPYRTQMNFVYDSGDFIGTMDKTLELADWNGFAARRKESEKRGKLRGIGLASFVEQAGGRPTEEMRVKIDANGRATVFAGTFSHGQGHETVYAQMVNDYLGIDFDEIDFVQGDTDTTPPGGVGTFGSRSSMMGGVAIRRSCGQIIVKGKKIAAHLLQADPDTVIYENGLFRVGVSSITIQEVARAASDPAKLPEGLKPGLDESNLFEREPDMNNFPNGCHICEVEVDPDLGTIQIVKYTALDDCGVVLNPLIVHGQVYGGVAQGIGQALTEDAVYDEESGQLLTGSFMDYGMPRAHHLSMIEAHFTDDQPCKTNDLGVKGAGEAGACGAPPAFVSAVCDALSPYGIQHIDMPLTPERVWSAIAQAKAHQAA
ncbi:MAG: xanthine dehydrogenase family protein molybdopterin-binding subunit [Alphaproteobacteria bacterium]|nr:xanthine dehydrogenase family protein molybdopterin-binding subunit [Alphaproteobacteria bacterium]